MLGGTYFCFFFSKLMVPSKWPYFCHTYYETLTSYALYAKYFPIYFCDFGNYSTKLIFFLKISTSCTSKFVHLRRTALYIILFTSESVYCTKNIFMMNIHIFVVKLYENSTFTICSSWCTLSKNIIVRKFVTNCSCLYFYHNRVNFHENTYSISFWRFIFYFKYQIYLTAKIFLFNYLLLFQNKGEC